MSQISAEELQRILDATLVKIDRVRAANRWDAVGNLYVPFTCYSCERVRSDYFMTTGDSLPMCAECFNGEVDAVTGGPT